MKRFQTQLPFAIGVGGTILAALFGGSVWLDNREGFRDAEAIATLLAAIFSMITTAWVVTTVLLQRADLDLQRQELALQREESRRIADETAHQAALMTEQLRIAVKQSIATEATTYFSLELLRFCGIATALRLRIAAITSERTGLSLSPQNLVNFYGSERVRATVKGTSEEVLIPYDELLDVLPEDYRLEVLNRWALRARAAGLDEWFRIELPYAIGNQTSDTGRKLTTRAIRLILNVAARMSFA